ncbi:glycosyltransferase family 4 protein [Halorubrum ruber]|uniref:Glycosyltransferase family 4 protein n=1 Tax=Halorubrum ruber TaxID=2982524 RepID=A0A8T8LJ61_9EURY|nr:glycosyltransferase family 4 protein [Halorubrum ruber]QUO46918.1 glycosyltransferase family 4 protein [Halorubrum ruber]
MRISFFCYNLSGTGPRTRARDIINGVAENSDHQVTVLTNEPDLVTEEANILKINLNKPVDLFQNTKTVFTNTDVAHVPINIWQVAFVRLFYSGPLVAGVGPGIQVESYYQHLGKFLGINRLIVVHEGREWKKFGYKTTICTATIDREIFHPYTENRIDKVRNELGISQDSKVVLYVGELTNHYGAELISETASFNDEFIYIVIGEGPLRSDIEENPNVRYEGYVNNRELPYYYNAADVTIGPRLSDVTSNVGLESIACGTPFITTATGYIQEFAVEPGAYIYSKRTAEALHETIVELLNDKERYSDQVQRGLGFIDSNPLTLDSAIETHLEVYDELTS